jgi:UTP:GlnB (protein PII) uridylyltransferase
LAYKIASALAALALDIVCAKIATEKSNALDVFYVTDGEGMKLSQSRMQSVQVSLAQMLSGEIPLITETGPVELLRPEHTDRKENF